MASKALVKKKTSDVCRFISNKITGGDISRIELHSIGAENATTLIDSWDISEGDKDNDLVKREIYESVQTAAANWSNTMGGMQRFGVMALDSTGTKTRQVFQMQGVDNDTLYGSEPATKAGLQAQLMRHNETLMRLHNQGMAATLKHNADMINLLGTELKGAFEQRVEFMTTLETLHSQKHEREMDLELQTASEQRKSDLLDQLMPYVPLVIAKITGQTTGEESSPVLDAAKGILSSFTEDQWIKLEGVLEPMQFGALVEFATHIQKEKESKDKGEKK